MSWRRRRHCPHVNVDGIYGDEINHVGGYRLVCADCGRYLDGPVSIAVDRTELRLRKAAREAEARAREGR